MDFIGFFNHNKLKFHNIKASTKIWKVQITLPCGFCLKKNDMNFEYDQIDHLGGIKLK